MNHYQWSCFINKYQFDLTAAERLAALQRELRETQKQVDEASRELNKLEEAATARKLTEAEKQKIRQKLAAKIQQINQVIINHKFNYARYFPSSRRKELAVLRETLITHKATCFETSVRVSRDANVACFNYKLCNQEEKSCKVLIVRA